MNMDRKKLLIALIMAAALIAAGAGGYTAGRNTASAQYMSGYEAGRQEASDRYKSGYDTGRKEADAEYKKERDLNILLHRSDLEGLKNVEGPIYVTGHKSPDTDTVGSSIGFAELLRQLGYDAHPVVLGKINPETQYVLEAADLEAPELLKDASGRNMVLVDHSEVMQSADGLSGANIVAIIDHHNAGTVVSKGPLIYDARPLGSTATIVWMRYRNYGLQPDRKTAIAMMGSILSDTQNLKTSATDADREALKALSELGGVTDIDSFFKDMYKASISYSGMTDEEIFFSDFKEYETEGVKYCIGTVFAYDEKSAQDLAKRLKKLLPGAVKSRKMDVGFANISIFHDDLDVTYLVPADETAAKAAEAAFGDKAGFDGTSYIFRPGVARKKVLVPAFNEVLADPEIWEVP